VTATAVAGTHTVKVAGRMAMAAVQTVAAAEQTVTAIAEAAAAGRTAEVVVGRRKVQPAAIGVVVIALAFAFALGTAAQPGIVKRVGLGYGTRKLAAAAVRSCPRTG